MKLGKIIFINRAPFENQVIDFTNTNVSILSGVNGSGKTTIISHIVDAFYEMAKIGYVGEFENKENKFYRVSSSLENINQNVPSIVYIKFFDESKPLDYINIRGQISKEDYDKMLSSNLIDNKIEYSKFSNQLRNNDFAKFVNISNEDVNKIFEHNLVTYFPAYRYEQPGYINDPYKIKLYFKKDNNFSGYLKNPIEVTSDLPDIINWIMDILLDEIAFRESTDYGLDILNELFHMILKYKFSNNISIAIGKRYFGAARIQIVDEKSSLYPSIFNMSAGELSLLCLFGELLKQSDKIQRKLNEVQGIVLIDELDKHLHIRLQKEVVPNLMTLFPNVQFIVTSHSPFLNLGLHDQFGDDMKIFDLDNGGEICLPEKNEIFREAYESMISANERYLEKYNELTEQIKKSTKTVILTEGKTDVKHLQIAQKILKIDEDIEYYDVGGDNELRNYLKKLSLIEQKHIIIGIFDRDNDTILKDIKCNEFGYEPYGNNVYAIVVPLVNYEEYKTKKISIEHYYYRNNLLKEDNIGRRLFLGDEFYLSQNSKDGNYQNKISKLQNKIEVNGIIDEKVYKSSDLEQKESIALTKNDFADLVSTNEEYRKDFDFSNFIEIFNIISKILKL